MQSILKSRSYEKSHWHCGSFGQIHRFALLTITPTSLVKKKKKKKEWAWQYVILPSYTVTSVTTNRFGIHWLLCQLWDCWSVKPSGRFRLLCCDGQQEASYIFNGNSLIFVLLFTLTCKWTLLELVFVARQWYYLFAVWLSSFHLTEMSSSASSYKIFHLLTYLSSEDPSIHKPSLENEYFPWFAGRLW